MVSDLEKKAFEDGRNFADSTQLLGIKFQQLIRLKHLSEEEVLHHAGEMEKEANRVLELGKKYLTDEETKYAQLRKELAERILANPSQYETIINQELLRKH